MKLRIYLAATLVAVTALTLAPNSATAGSNQQCSQRGGSRNTIITTCVFPTVTLGDVKAKFTHVDVLSNNDIDLTVGKLVDDIDVLKIRDFDVLSGRSLVYLRDVLNKNVLQVCTGKKSPNFCRS